MKRTSILVALLALSLSCRPQGAEVNNPTPDQNENTNTNTDTNEANQNATATPQEEVVALVFPKEEFRKNQPAAGEPRDFKTPSLEQFKLKNGIEVYLLERHLYPTVSMQLVFEGGSINDPANKTGLAGVCMGLLSQGTETLDKVAFEEALADLASSIGSFAGNDQQYVTMSTLKKNLDPTLDLWVDTLMRPGMRQEDFDRDIKRTLTSIEQAKSSPGAIASRLFSSILYGEKHPFGRIRTKESISAITLNDCKQYVSTYLKPQGAKLYVLGDITRAEVEEKIGGKLAAFKGKPKASAKPGKLSPRKGKIFFVDVPGAAQSVVLMTHEGPKRKAPDYFATTLMSSVLGGGFSSRINMNLREQHGYAYGAFGGFFYDRNAGAFFVQASVRSDVTKESIQEIFKELKKMREEGATEAELLREVEGEILSLPSQWSTGNQTLGTFRNLLYYGLPLNYYDGYVDGLQKVTLEDIKKAAKSYVRPDDLKILVVGDGASVLPKLEELLASGEIGKGDIVKLDSDGNVVK